MFYRRTNDVSKSPLMVSDGDDLIFQQEIWEKFLLALHGSTVLLAFHTKHTNKYIFGETYCCKKFLNKSNDVSESSLMVSDGDDLIFQQEIREKVLLDLA